MVDATRPPGEWDKREPTEIVHIAGWSGNGNSPLHLKPPQDILAHNAGQKQLKLSLVREMPLTLRVYKRLLDDNDQPIPPDHITLNGLPVSGTPDDEVSYERGTQGNDGQGGFDYMYLGTGVLGTTNTITPGPKGKMFFVAVGGGKLVDLQCYPAVIETNQPPSAVLDGFQVFNPNSGTWENAFVFDSDAGAFAPNPIIISKEGTVFDASTDTLVFPFKVRLVVNPTDPSGRHEFFIVLRAFEV